MLRKMMALVIGLGLAGVPEAQADEAGYKIARGVGYGGLISAGAGPLVTVGGIAVLAGSVEESDGGYLGVNTGQLGTGAIMVVSGFGVTALAPAVVVGSSLGGHFSVKDMGGNGSFIPGVVGAAGVGIQFAGIAMAFSDPTGPHTAFRVLGWGTGLVGGGVQMLNNGKHYRDAAGLSMGRHRKVHIGLVPAPNGAAVVGIF